MMPTVTEQSSLPAEERVKLVKELLEQCPPGEFSDALHDIQTILGDDQLLAELHEAIKERNIQSGSTVNITIDEESQSLLLTEFNELADGRFYDPDSGVVVTINHFNLVFFPLFM